MYIDKVLLWSIKFTHCQLTSTFLIWKLMWNYRLPAKITRNRYNYIQKQKLSRLFLDTCWVWRCCSFLGEGHLACDQNGFSKNLGLGAVIDKWRMNLSAKLWIYIYIYLFQNLGLCLYINLFHTYPRNFHPAIFVCQSVTCRFWKSCPTYFSLFMQFELQHALYKEGNVCSTKPPFPSTRDNRTNAANFPRGSFPDLLVMGDIQ